MASEAKKRAHEAHAECCKHGHDAGDCDTRKAIDDIPERGHVPGCNCHNVSPNMDGYCNEHSQHPYVDPRCGDENETL